MKAHVVIALSGGVDSAVAAARLLDEGYIVSALFMKNWEDDDTDSFCPSAADYASAKDVCARLEIPLHAVNFSAQYRDRVFRQFLADCAAGLTPNPDVLCNREIKFDVFWQQAQALGAQFMATGHYVRRRDIDGQPQLLVGADPERDQSYFLHTIDPAILPFTLFPIGDQTKPTVRAKAAALGLTNATRKGSSGICFIGERHFKPFLQRYLRATPGIIQTPNGQTIGQHDGLMYYTIGQRQGLGIGGPGEAWYVADKRMTDNILIVVQGHHHPLLYHTACHTASPYWLGPTPAFPWHGTAKIRYRQPAQLCRVTKTAHGLHIVFKEPQRAITPGQSAVFYAEDVCLGGAIITARENT